MNHIALKTSLIALALIVVTQGIGPKSVQATPALQLDILGGSYNASGTMWDDDTIVTDQTQFHVRALLNRNAVSDITDLSAQDYSLAIALVPRPSNSDSNDLESFTIGDSTVKVTADMTWGKPPLEGILATKDGGDLGSHSIYDTWFYEHTFQFSADDEYDLLNTQDNPGTAYTQVLDGDTMFVVDFLLDLSNFESDGLYGLHFDLYDTSLKKNGDLDINKFAPFSHDAEARPGPLLPGPTAIPEPASLAIWSALAAGAALAASRRRNRRRRWSETNRQSIRAIIERG